MQIKNVQCIPQIIKIRGLEDYAMSIRLNMDWSPEENSA